VTTTLQLQEGSLSLGTVTNQFPIGKATVSTNSFVNAGAISIPSRNAATPYPSVLTVPDLTNPVTKLTLTLSNLSHTQPDDLDILLVGPGGQTVLLMSDVGGSTDLNNVTLVFDDAAPAVLPDAGTIVSGAWVPTNVGVDEILSAPAPAGPYGTALSVFNGLPAAGEWSLYVHDDANQNSGGIANGWSLTFTTRSSPGCCVNPSPLELSISDASVVEGDSAATTALFIVTLSRPVGQTVTVLYATSDDTAIAGSDYVATNGVVQFNPGQTNRGIRVPVLGDRSGETNETFLVTLGGPTEAVLGRSRGVGTIVDDEIRMAAPTLSGLDLEVRFHTVTGRSYRVERTDALTMSNVWTTVPGAALLSGTGGLVPGVDTNALTQPQRFYRVRQVEP